MANELNQQIRAIRDRLHENRAAVLVGAGFSRNSQPNENADPLPLWKDLARYMFDDVFPEHAADLEKGKAFYNWLAKPLELAQRFEDGDRTRIDSMIEALIPDLEHQPGPLHKKLMKLPWNGVFVLNYDTLIERARDGSGRNYSVVYNEQDLHRPGVHITKLHGSIGHRGYVITENDFREYSSKKEALVTKVHNSLSENTWCLLGCSGDDPNFKAWNNWALKHLKTYKTTTYLVGFWVGMEASERRQWEREGVRLVDITPLGDGANPYQTALNTFISRLEMSPSASMPTSGTPSQPRKDSEWPPTTGSNATLLSPSFFDGSLAEAFLDAIPKWRNQRLGYPGWLVAPNKSRNTLRQYTDHWFESDFKVAKSLPPSTTLILLHELTWRWARCLNVVMLHQAEAIAELLETANPFKEELPTERIDVTQEELKTAWIHLAMVICREAREDLDTVRHAYWLERLDKIVKGEWRQHFRYEAALMNMFKLDPIGLRQALNAWRPGSALSWRLKKASLLLELGDLSAAKRLLKPILELSEEGLTEGKASILVWGLFAHRTLKTAESPFDSNWRADVNKRENILRKQGHDAFAEMRLVGEGADTLKVPAPPTSVTYNFDPGDMTRTQHLGSEAYHELRRPALNLLSLPEEAGIPLRCGRHSTLAKLPGAARGAWPFAPLWALSAYARHGGEDKIVNTWLTTPEIRGQVQATINTASNLFVPALTQLAEGLPSGDRRTNSMQEQVLPALMEVVSRLAIRFNPSQVETFLKAAFELAENTWIQKDFALHKPLAKLFKRALRTAPPRVISAHLHKLATLGAPGLENFSGGPRRINDWPEALLYIQLHKAKQLNPDPDALAEAISDLLELAYGQGESRHRGLRRLLALKRYELLSPEQKGAFSAAVFARTDKEAGLPADTWLYPTEFISDDFPESKRITTALKSLILEMPFPTFLKESEPDRNAFSQKWQRDWGTVYHQPDYSSRLLMDAYMGASLTTENRVHDNSLPFINWTVDEAKILLEKLWDWWECESERLVELRESPFGGGNIGAHVSTVTVVLSRVILPRLSVADTATQARALALVSRLRDTEFGATSAFPACLYLSKVFSDADAVYEAIKADLDAEDDGDVVEACTGLYLWLAYRHLDDVPGDPARLFAHLVDQIIAQAEPELLERLNVATHIVRDFPNIVGSDLQPRLEYTLGRIAKQTDVKQSRVAATKTGASETPVWLRRKASELAIALKGAGALSPESVASQLLQEDSLYSPIELA